MLAGRIRFWWKDENFRDNKKILLQHFSNIYTKSYSKLYGRHTNTFTQAHKKFCFSLLQNRQPLTNRPTDQVPTDQTNHRPVDWDFFIERFMSNSLVVFVTCELTLFMLIYLVVYPIIGLPLHSLRYPNWLHLKLWNFASQ